MSYSSYQDPPWEPWKWSDELFQAIGRFITAYATAEAYAHAYMRHLSGLSDRKARILFAGMALSDIKERMRGLARLKGNPAILAEIDYVLAQLDLIREKRNLVAHRTIEFPYAGKAHVTNEMTAKNISLADYHPLDIDEMNAMRRDCDKICYRFAFLALNKLRSCEEVNELLGPWAYKPAQRSATKGRRERR
jgi:hypothetical protein